jgi:glycosyltransferase involved in cell wall biosynthesis
MNKRINVLFFIPELNQISGGLRQYSAALLKLLNEISDDYNFYIFHNGKDEEIMNILRFNYKLHWIDSNFSFATIENSFKKKIQRIKKILGIETKVLSPLDKLLLEYKIDIIHSPYQYLPNTVLPIKKIVTIHDVQELYFPHFFSAHERAWRAENYMNFIKEADRVVVSYNHIKNDIIRFFSKDEEKINVLLLKMDFLWFSKFSNRKKVNNESKYLLYPANFWEHKNHERLIHAIKLLKDRGVQVNLVLTGNNDNNVGSRISQIIQELNLEDLIEIRGIVNEEELFNLYLNSHGVVVPTLYEAGSFPLMESILLNIPVVCSNVTSLPDTIGDLKFIFNPYSIDDIAEKIEMLWTNEEFRKDAIKNNSIQKPKLIDTGAEDKLISLYNSIVSCS